MTDLATLRARHAQLCEQINEDATPFRDSPNRVACAERDRLWAIIEELPTCACCGDRFECDDPSDPDNVTCPTCSADTRAYWRERREAGYPVEVES